MRSEGEYEDGHIAGSLNIPGGQAVQRADDFVAVKNGRIIFVSNQSARAVMAAYWYRQMGFRDVKVLQGGLEAWRESGGAVESGGSQKEPLGFEAAKKSARVLAPGEVNSLLQGSTASVLHVGSSTDFAAVHLPGSKWISRGWLELKLPSLWTDKDWPIVLSCRDGQESIFAARTLAEMGYKEISVLDGGVQLWARAGYPTERGSGVLPGGAERCRIVAFGKRRQGSDAALPGMGNQTHAVSCSRFNVQKFKYSDRFGSSSLCPNFEP